MKRVDIEKIHIQESLRQDFDGTIQQRVDRYLKVKPHAVVTETHFAPVSSEVTLLFRDGHYYGCIALAQAVAEALVRFICKRNHFKPGKDFDKNVDTLTNRKLIDEHIKNTFSMIWERRDDYHHLNPGIEQDRQKLEDLAFKKLKLLADVEKEIFAYTLSNGKIKPKYPKYWDIDGNQAKVFLRIDP